MEKKILSAGIFIKTTYKRIPMVDMHWLKEPSIVRNAAQGYSITVNHWGLAMTICSKGLAKGHPENKKFL